MVDANFFCHQKKRKVKLDKVREGLRPITLRFRANARRLILGSIGTPLDHLSVNKWLCYMLLVLRIMHSVFGMWWYNCYNGSVKQSLVAQQYSTNENPSLSRNNFLANLMHGHRDSSWSGCSLPEITEQRIFHVLFHCEQIRLKCIINCIYPSWLNF